MVIPDYSLIYAGIIIWIRFMNGASEPPVLGSHVGDKRLVWKNPAVRWPSAVQLSSLSNCAMSHDR